MVKHVQLGDLLAGLSRSGTVTVSAARALARDILDLCESVDPTEEESEWERYAVQQNKEFLAEVEREMGAVAPLGGDRAMRRREELAQVNDQRWRSEVMRMGLDLREPTPHLIQVMKAGEVHAEWWPAKAYLLCGLVLPVSHAVIVASAATGRTRPSRRTSGRAAAGATISCRWCVLSRPRRGRRRRASGMPCSRPRSGTTSCGAGGGASTRQRLTCGGSTCRTGPVPSAHEEHRLAHRCLRPRRPRGRPRRLEGLPARPGAGRHEPAARDRPGVDGGREVTQAVQVFDLRGEPHQLARDEWTPHVRRDPAEMPGVVLHQWAVRQVGTASSLRARYGEPLALARRALAAPYTISCGVTAHGGVPVVSIAHPLERYTYASDAGNKHYLAVGVMGLFPFTERARSSRHTPHSEALQAAVARALEVAAELLVTSMRDPGVDVQFLVITHRQCINGRGDHETCPGEVVVEMAAKALRGDAGPWLSLDPDLTLDARWSRPWPDEWRRHLSASGAEGQQDEAKQPCLPAVDLA
jgi:hypothetical protein